MESAFGFPIASTLNVSNSKSTRLAELQEYRERAGLSVRAPIGAIVFMVLLFQLAPTAMAQTVFTHVTDGTNTLGSNTILNHPSINDDPDAPIIISRIYNTDGGSSGVFNEHFVGVRYSNTSGRWAIENTDQETLPLGVVFRVLVVDPSETFFVHELDSETSGTRLDHPSLEGNPDARIFLTRNASPGGSGPFQRADVGLRVFWNGSWWTLNFQDSNGSSTTLPAGTAFNVYVPPPSATTVVHVTDDSNLSAGGAFSTIDIPVANGNPLAAVFATKLTPSGSHVGMVPPVGLRYDGNSNRWAIYPENDLASLSENMHFQVLYVPDFIFFDRFESAP